MQNKAKKIYPLHVLYFYFFMNYQICFDDKTIWKPSYCRNNKGKSQKNILCFPDHRNRGHIV